MSTTWVLVADSARARLFTAGRPRGPLNEIQTFTYPEARLQERQLGSDRPGRVFDRAGEGRHAMGQSVDPAEQTALEFSRLLAEQLDDGRKADRFEKLIIVASPGFLGLLRKAVNAETARRVTLEIDKNLVQMDPDEIRGHLPERI